MDVSSLLPNLAVGSYPATADDVDRLATTYGVTAVLNVQTEDDFAYWNLDWQTLAAEYQRRGLEVRRVPVRDFDADDLRRNLPACVETLRELLDQDHTVLVHCNLGVGRSPSVVIAYLHWVQNWDFDQAAQYLAVRRECSPNLDAIRLATADRQEKGHG